MSVNAKNFIFFTFAILFLCNLLAWVAVFDLSQPQFLEVNFFDVGQGDAIFIETPGRHQILIDGGPDSTVLEKLGQNLPFWDRSIDLIILTHPEADHIVGLIEVLKRYKVDYILWTGVIRETAEYEEWKKVIEKEGAQMKIAKASQKIIFPQTYCLIANLDQCVFFDVLYPLENLAKRKMQNSNNTSIVARLVFGQNSFLFTGDAYKSVEKRLIESQAGIVSDILKIAHHGSKTSSSKEFIEAVSSEIAVISVGKDNRYGHPHREVLENLAGIKILRTDLDGDIKIISDGTKYQLKY